MPSGLTTCILKTKELCNCRIFTRTLSNLSNKITTTSYFYKTFQPNHKSMPRLKFTKLK